MQKLLFGEPGDPDAFGSGTVPLDLIGDRVVMARGNVSDAYDTVRVKHVSGKWSTCRFRPYRAGREAFQGVTLQFIVFDEEPPPDVYFEGLTRISATRGRSLVLLRRWPDLPRSRAASPTRTVPIAPSCV
jgi:phage terminase large subunit-like protein